MKITTATKTQTTYVITGRDLFEAIIGLGIPRDAISGKETSITHNEEAMLDALSGGPSGDGDEPVITIEVEAVTTSGTPPEAGSPASPGVQDGDPLPIGTILRYSTRGADHLFYVIGHHAGMQKYKLWDVQEKEPTWDRYEAVRQDRNWTIIRRPNLAQPAFKGAFAIGTVFQNRIDRVPLVVIGYYPYPLPHTEGAYHTYAPKAGYEKEYHAALLDPIRYIVLYDPRSGQRSAGDAG